MGKRVFVPYSAMATAINPLANFSARILRAIAALHGIDLDDRKDKEKISDNLLRAGIRPGDVESMLRLAKPKPAAPATPEEAEDDAEEGDVDDAEVEGDSESVESGTEMSRSQLLADLSRKVNAPGRKLAQPIGDIGSLVLRYVQRKDGDFTPEERKAVLNCLVQSASLVNARNPKLVSADDKRILKTLRVFLDAQTSESMDLVLFGASSMVSANLSRLYVESLKYSSSASEATRMSEILRRSGLDLAQVELAQAVTAAARDIVPDSVVEEITRRAPPRPATKKPAAAAYKKRVVEPTEATPRKRTDAKTCAHCKRGGHASSDCWIAFPDKRPNATGAPGVKPGAHQRA